MGGEEFFQEAIARCHSLFEQASQLAVKEPMAMSLATTDRNGQPSVRMVLLRGFDERGFVFYTNADSRKGHQLAENPRAAICMHWDDLREQLRAEGTTQKVDDVQSDQYWSSRPRLSQLAAIASLQSEVLHERKLLEDEVDRLDEMYAGQDVPRPDFWYGFRLVPDRIEFWSGREGRLHERTLYTLVDGNWSGSLLYP